VNTVAARRRIQELEHLNAFISLTGEEGEGPVVAVKDLVDVRATVTTAGGTLLPRVPAGADAPIVSAVRASGCTVVGKANLHEFALGVTNANPHYGRCLNPRDPARVPGGSSGGSAAAVAAGMCDWSIGTDTGGSVRIPAGLCGVVGVKPTTGMLSTEGIVPLAWSLDTPGPLAPDVRSAATALEWMSGRSGLVPTPVKPAGSFRVGVLRQWVGDLDDATRAAWSLVTQGLPTATFPRLEELTAIYQPIFFCEAAAYHRRWVEETPESYGADVLGSLQRGMKVAGMHYVEATRARPQAIEAVEHAMRDWDAVLVPTTAIVAPAHDAQHVREPLLRFTRPFNVTGQPVVSLPAPTSGELPVGIQVVGHRGDDAGILAVAAALETAWSAGSSRRDGPDV
jgi:aspartyl-tRNA(Asn)/glutamyl-tRNA(Gln) amidotransferase subunit A